MKETIYGVTVEPRVEDLGRHDDEPTLPAVWVRVSIMGVTLYDGPIAEFDNDYNVVERMVLERQIPELKLRLAEALARDAGVKL